MTQLNHKVTKVTLFKSLCASMLALSASTALAHYPILNCKGNAEQDAEIVCEAGFSDHSMAPNVLVEVYSEDDELVASGKTDERSIYRFQQPGEVYFIIMDAGPGHVLEISNEEVVPL